MRIAIALISFSLFMASAEARPPVGEEAFRRAKRTLERDPEDRDALREVLDLSHVVGGLRKLVGIYQDKTTAKPKDGGSHLILAHLLRHAGDCGRALEAYAASEKLLSGSAGPHLGAAECHRLGERWGAAVLAYQAGLKKSLPRRRKVAALERLVQVALKAEQPAVARKAYEQLVAADPRNPGVRVDHAKALERAGRLQMAVDVWRDVHKVARSDHKTKVLATTEMGRLLGRLGRMDEAVAVYRSALKKLPAEHWAQLELQEGLIAVYRRQAKLDVYVAELEKRRRTYPILVLLARLYEETGADRKALAAYRTAVTQRPANVEARNAMLRILKRIGTRTELVEEYRTLIRKVADEPRYELELAELYLSESMTEQAFKLLDRVSRKYSQDPGIHESIADLFMRHGADRARIEREFHAMMRLEPDEEQHIIQLGEYYFGEDARSKATATWQKLLRTVPDKGKAHLLLARLYAEHEMQEEAINHFREAFKRHPKKIKYYRSFAVYLEKINKYRDASGIWAKIIELLPHDDHTRIRQARERIIRIFGKQGTLRFKLQDYRRRFAADPPDPEAGLYLAQGLIHQKDFEAAAVVLEKLVASRPKDPQGLIYLEEVYEKLNRLGDAIAILQRIAEVDKAAAREHLQRMAELSMSLHRTEDALKFARLVVDLNPTDQDAQTHLGDIHVQMRNYGEALLAYRHSLRLAPGNFPVMFKLVTVLDQLGREGELIEALTEIVRTASEPADILNAGRRIMAAPALDVLEQFEPVLLNAVFQRSHKPIYRKLLVDLYAAIVKRLTLVRGPDDTEAAIAARLRRVGERGLKPILDSLADADLAVRTRVLRVLVSSRNPNAVLPLVRLLEEKDRVLKFQALVTLAHLGTASAVAPVAKLTSVRQGTVGPGAIWALGAFKSKKAGAALSGLVKLNSQRNDRGIVALALGARGRTDGTEAALELFGHGHKGVRPYAAWALGAIGDARALEPLLRRLPLESARTQEIIVWSLGAIGSPKALGPLLRIAWGRQDRLVPLARWAVSRVLSPSPLDKDALREIYLGLHEFDRARIDMARAFPALLRHDVDAKIDVARLLKTHAKVTRRILLEQLSGAEPTVAVRVLAALMPRTEKASGLVLGPLAPDAPIPNAWMPPLVKAVTKLSRGRALEVRLAAVELLGRVDTPEALEGLSKALEDDSPAVRRTAALAMRRADPTRAVPLLLDAVTTGALRASWSGRAAAALALESLLPLTPTYHARAVDALRAMLTDAYPLVRSAALSAIRPLGPSGKSLVNPIIDLLADPDGGVVLQAVHALGAIKSPMAVKPLDSRAKSPDPALRRAVKEALEAIRNGG